MTTAPKTTKAQRARTASLKAEQEAEWRKKLEKNDEPPKAYKMDQVYRLDDRVDHQLFGVGLVVSLIPPGKINVFFQDGLKLMKCG
jgi:hypothetical protein